MKTKLQIAPIPEAELQLCYVEDSRAYFTTRQVEEEWGNAWGDVPYEHNAGPPAGADGHEIVCVMWAGPFDLPRAGYRNSPWSVRAVNRRAVPWLRSSAWSNGEHVTIWAGATLDEFLEYVRRGGGSVYMKVEPEPS